MKRRFQCLIAALVLCATVADVSAEEAGVIAPVPAFDDLQRIAPAENGEEEAILSTKPAATVGQTEPRANAAPATLQPSPNLKLTAPATGPTPFGTKSPASAAKPNSYIPSSVPFGRASMPAKTIPEGPHTSVATPVTDVDEVEASEPAPPTPVAAEESPATQDPTEPTELTSPIFDTTGDAGAPRKIVFRVLNKVTGQSGIFRAKPGEVVKFGKLEVNPIICRASMPSSQSDYAGLFDVSEQLPAGEVKKKLFRGWMYASTPSIAALEHPIYDLTMVGCDIATPPPKKEADKSDKKADKKPLKKLPL